jgi:hypothetical protein
MRWSQYLDESLKVLEEAKESPTDQLLVYLTRIQLICNTVITEVNSSGDSQTTLPTEIFIETIKSKFDNLRLSIPRELSSNSKHGLIIIF